MEIKLRNAGGNLEIEINFSFVNGELSSLKLPKMKMVTFLANWEIFEKKNRQISLPVAANFVVQTRISTNVPHTPEEPNEVNGKL